MNKIIRFITFFLFLSMPFIYTSNIINNMQPSSGNDQLMPDEWYLHLYQLMKDIHELFTLHKLEYWAQGGTLLGAIRHKGIIKWDDDLDINIKLKDKELFVSLIPILEKLNYEVTPTWFGYKVVHQHIFTFNELKGAPCVDIFFMF